MRTYSDEQIEYWGERYINLNLNRELGIPFIAFLSAPHTYLQLLHETIAADAAPLLPDQQNVVLRMSLAEMDDNESLNCFL